MRATEATNALRDRLRAGMQAAPPPLGLAAAPPPLGLARLRSPVSPAHIAVPSPPNMVQTREDLPASNTDNHGQIAHIHTEGRMVAKFKLRVAKFSSGREQSSPFFCL